MRVPGGPARFLKTRSTVAAFVLAAFALASVTGFVWADKHVIVFVDGVAREFTTDSIDVASLLAEAGVRFTSVDLVSPAPDSELVDDGVVVVRHAVPVTLHFGQASVRLNVVGHTVADALVSAGLDPTSGMRTDPPVDRELAPGMHIRATDVFIRLSEEEVPLPYDVVVIGDPRQPAGSRRAVTAGVVGRALRVYQVLVVGGVEGPRFLKLQKVLSPRVTEVVSIGTKRPFRQVMSHGDSRHRRVVSPTPPIVGRTFTIRSTAYTPWDAGCGGIGVIARRKARYRIPDGWGVVAVDPRVIPLGTKLFVDGYGYAVAADTGGAIKGDIIDVCFWGADTSESVTSAGVAQRAAAFSATRRWGRRTVRVTILGR